MSDSSRNELPSHFKSSNHCQTIRGAVILPKAYFLIIEPTFYKYRSKIQSSSFFVTSFSSLPKVMAARSLSKRCSHLATASFQSSVAKIFLQLAPPQRYIHTAPLLDFLAPNVTLTYSVKSRKIERPHTNVQKSISRGFTSSSLRRQTSAIVNPRQDDDGMDMTMEITPRASNVCLRAPRCRQVC